MTRDAGMDVEEHQAQEVSAGQCLLMSVADDWFLLDMASLQEVVSAPAVTSVPTAPATVMGLFNLRGQIVPLLDTGVVLGINPMGSAPFALVVATDLGPVGLATSRLPESVLPGESIGRSELPGTSTTHAFGKRIAAMLEVETLLVPDRIGA